MALTRVVFTNNHDYTYGYEDIESYRIQTINQNKIVLRYDGDSDRADRYPDRIVMKIEDGVSYTPKRGEWEGETFLRAGTVKNVKMFDSDGDLLQRVTKVDANAATVSHFLYDEPDVVWPLLIGSGATFIGNPSDERGVDVMTGQGDDVVRLKAGGSFIKDVGGADKYLGTNESFDTVTYDNWDDRELVPSMGVDADLRAGQIVGPDGEVDIVRSIDRIIGTHADDRMAGNGKDNQFQGLLGNDVFDGRRGFDTVQYDRDEREGGYDGINANLGKGRVVDGFGTIDRLKNIEGIEATDFDDVIRDSRKDNYINGNDGDDRILIKRGDDYIRGDDGGDRFIFRSSNFDHNTIEDFNGDEGDRIVIKAANKIGDLDISSDSNGTTISLDDDNRVFLQNYFGEVADYLVL